MENNSLNNFIKSSPGVQAAITEAVHRFYFDRILSEREQDKIDLKETNCSDVLGTLWNLMPNWRYILEKTAKRYHTTNTNSVSIYGKPENIVGLEITLKY